MNRSLLLDFDGVVFRNKEALRAVEKKSSEFTLQYIPVPANVSYQTYGHTVNMVNSLKKDLPKVTLQDYNRYVFDRPLLESTRDMIGKDDLLRAKMWKHLVEKHNGDTCIFSNAPEVWIRCVLSFLDIDEVFLEKKILCPCTLNDLKPADMAYTRVLKDRKKASSLFIDDSVVNIEAARKLDIPSMLYTGEVDRALIESYQFHVKQVSKSL